MATCQFKFTLTIENGESSSFGDGSPQQLNARNLQVAYLIRQAAGQIATGGTGAECVATDGTVAGSWEFS